MQIAPPVPVKMPTAQKQTLRRPVPMQVPGNWRSWAPWLLGGAVVISLLRR